MSHDEEESREHKIINELRKTGYPTEIVAATTLERLGWQVTHNPSYLDDTEGVSREFDLWARRPRVVQADSKVFPVSVDLIIACKKSARAPWVFFMTPSGPGDSRLIKTDLASAFLFWTPNVGEEPVLSHSDLKGFHHYFNRDAPRARTYHEVFKGRETSGERAQSIYSTVMSCTKAVLFRRRIHAHDVAAAIYYPVIVCSGELFEAHVASADTIELKAVEHLQLSHHYTRSMHEVSWWEVESEFVVDIVRDSYLEQFLQTIEREQEMLATHLETAIRVGRLRARDAL